MSFVKNEKANKKNGNKEKNEKATTKNNNIIPYNVNEYRHLLSNNINNKEIINWMIDLRKEVSFPQLINNKEPVFIYNKIDKCKKKYNSMDYNSNIDLKHGYNMGTFKFLSSTRNSNPSLINFETQLRVEIEKVKLKEKKILKGVFEKKDVFEGFLPPLLRVSQNNIKRLGELVSRKSSIIFNKKTYDNKSDLIIHKLVEDDNSSRVMKHGKYIDRYNKESISKIDFLLREKFIKVDDIKWVSCLRSKVN